MHHPSNAMRQRCPHHIECADQIDPKSLIAVMPDDGAVDDDVYAGAGRVHLGVIRHIDHPLLVRHIQ